VAIEALDVARRELGISDGGSEGLCVSCVGARHGDQALHRAVRRNLPGHNEPLHCGRQHPDQVQPSRDPVLGAPQTECDCVEVNPLYVHQFLNEEGLFEGRQWCAGLTDANPEKRF